MASKIKQLLSQYWAFILFLLACAFLVSYQLKTAIEEHKEMPKNQFGNYVS